MLVSILPFPEVQHELQDTPRTGQFLNSTLYKLFKTLKGIMIRTFSTKKIQHICIIHHRGASVDATLTAVMYLNQIRSLEYIHDL